MLDLKKTVKYKIELLYLPVYYRFEQNNIIFTNPTLK